MRNLRRPSLSRPLQRGDHLFAVGGDEGFLVAADVVDVDLGEAEVGEVAQVVLVNRVLPHVSGTVIWPGYDRGGFLAVEHLIATGRRRIAYLGLEEADQADDDKLRGYRQALAHAAIPFDPMLVRRGPRTFQGGFDAMAALVGEHIPVDGLFAFNDLMAIGAMRYAALHRIAVPAELAVVGFGGSDVASMVTPALSTIIVPLYGIGTTAVQELLDLIQQGGQEQRQVRSEPQLAVRGSSTAADHRN